VQSADQTYGLGCDLVGSGRLTQALKAHLIPRFKQALDEATP
jgi:hypothetical protein